MSVYDDKPVRAVAIIGLKKPVDLAAAQMKQCGSVSNSQPTFTDLLDGSSRCNSFCDKVTKQGMTTPQNLAVDQI